MDTVGRVERRGRSTWAACDRCDECIRASRPNVSSPADLPSRSDHSPFLCSEIQRTEKENDLAESPFFSKDPVLLQAIACSRVPLHEHRTSRPDRLQRPDGNYGYNTLFHEERLAPLRDTSMQAFGHARAHAPAPSHRALALARARARARTRARAGTSVDTHARTPLPSAAGFGAVAPPFTASHSL
eukprot:2176100-Pleurochrysis_carterae.AAC.1